MTKVRDVRPGQHFRRPDVKDGTRVLVKLANPHNSGHNGADHFSFDPENFELIGSFTGSTNTVPVEPKRAETRNHISFSDDELRLIEAVLSNVSGSGFRNLISSACSKIRDFLPCVNSRPPYKVMLNGQFYAIKQPGMEINKEQE